jgi:hypothetical protein
LLGTFSRTSLTYGQITGTGSSSSWTLSSDVTSSSGKLFIQFSWYYLTTVAYLLQEKYKIL